LLHADFRRNPFLQRFLQKKKRQTRTVTIDAREDAFLNFEELNEKFEEELMARNLEDVLQLSTHESLICKLQ